MTLRFENTRRLALAGICAAFAGAASAQAIIVEARGTENPLYKEMSGTWVDAGGQSSAPGALGSAPGARRLDNPSPTQQSAVELHPALGGAQTVRVDLTWPATANARGLMLTLDGSAPPQSHPVLLDPKGVNGWTTIGEFNLAGVSDPKFRLVTTPALAPADPASPLAILIDAIRFTPASAAPAATGSSFGQPVASDPFSDAPASPFDQPTAVGANPFNSAAAASPANPFNAAPAPANPFGGAPASATPAPVNSGPLPDDPFASSIPVAAAPSAPPPAPAAVSADPFASSTSPADPFGTAPVTASAPPPAASNDPFGNSAPIPTPPPARTTAIVASPTNTDNDPFAVVPSPSVATVAPADPFADNSVAIGTPNATTPAGLEAGAATGAPGETTTPTTLAADTSPRFVPAPGPDTMTADPFNDGAGEAANPALPQLFVRDSSKPLAVIDGQAPKKGDKEETPQRVITTDLPQPVPNRAPTRTLATALIVGDSQMFASSGQRASYNPLFDTVKREHSDEAGERIVEIQWEETFAAAEARSQKEKKPLVIVFYDDTANSQAFSLNVLAKARIGEAMNRAVPVRLKSVDSRELMAKLRAGSPPYVVVLDKFGFTRGHVSERKDATIFLEQLNRNLQ